MSLSVLCFLQNYNVVLQLQNMHICDLLAWILPDNEYVARCYVQLCISTRDVLCKLRRNKHT